ncbi:MAG: hypothetical protein PHO41_03980 [Eubacteriales bacterium]|nr:hypothetical protein [Eubacteriales bacterium]
MPSQAKRKKGRHAKVTRIIALTLAIVLLGSIMLAAAVSNLF